MAAFGYRGEPAAAHGELTSNHSLMYFVKFRAALRKEVGFVTERAKEAKTLFNASGGTFAVCKVSFTC